MNNKLSVAIVHDYIKDYGGAERVLERLIKIFPNAHIYTSLFAPEHLGPHRKRFEDYDIRTTWINELPAKEKLISPLRLLSPFAFKGLDLSSYDVIIVSQTGAYYPNLVRKGKAKLFCYTHTPPRYLYGYMTARKIGGFSRAISAVAFNALRIVDSNASKNVDQFIANSEEVKKRIEKFYRRDAVVIYPPVELPNVVKGKKEDYFVAGGRLARAKGIDVIVDAFSKNGLKLKVFGKGFAGYGQELMRKGKKNIEFLGEVTDEKKFELLAAGKAYVFASYDEDFGITPVEAMGVGTPVIAFKSGGVKETVIDGKTGVFYKPNTPESLNNAIEKLETLRQAQGNKMSDACVLQAEKFSEKEFDKKIRQLIETLK